MPRVTFVLAATVAMATLVIVPSGSAYAADGKISGAINIQGKPLLEGRILFHVGNGQFIGCKIKDGKYSLDRVPVGTHAVTIEGKGIPALYGDETTSPLNADVKEGLGTFDFEVK